MQSYKKSLSESFRKCQRDRKNFQNHQIQQKRLMKQIFKTLQQMSN